jgi:hypothetical protein
MKDTLRLFEEHRQSMLTQIERPAGAGIEHQADKTLSPWFRFTVPFTDCLAGAVPDSYPNVDPLWDNAMAPLDFAFQTMSRG